MFKMNLSVDVSFSVLLNDVEILSAIFALTVSFSLYSLSVLMLSSMFAMICVGENVFLLMGNANFAPIESIHLHSSGNSTFVYISCSLFLSSQISSLLVSILLMFVFC